MSCCIEGSMKAHLGQFYTVVSGGGDFKEGAQFLMSHFERTLRMGNWPAGMVVEKDGKKYRVVHVLKETDMRGPDKEPRNFYGG